MAGFRNAGDDRGNGSDGDVNALKDRVIMGLIAVILGGGGAAGYLGANPPRPDPFTGSDAARLEEKIMRQIEIINLRDEALRERLDAHLQRADTGFYRIDRLEKKVETIEKSHRREAHK